jgi:hypothetical protein
VDYVQPKGVDRFRRESATQQLQTDRAAIAFFATPDDAVAGTQFRQWKSTSRTKKFSIHAGMMWEVKGAVHRGEPGSREPCVCGIGIVPIFHWLEVNGTKLPARHVSDWPFPHNFIK